MLFGIAMLTPDVVLYHWANVAALLMTGTLTVQLSHAVGEDILAGQPMLLPNAGFWSTRRINSTPLTMLPHWSEPPICSTQPRRRSSSRKSTDCISM